MDISPLECAGCGRVPSIKAPQRLADLPIQFAFLGGRTSYFTIIARQLPHFSKAFCTKGGALNCTVLFKDTPDRWIRFANETQEIDKTAAVPQSEPLVS